MGIPPWHPLSPMPGALPERPSGWGWPCPQPAHPFWRSACRRCAPCRSTRDHSSRKSSLGPMRGPSAMPSRTTRSIPAARRRGRSDGSAARAEGGVMRCGSTFLSRSPARGLLGICRARMPQLYAARKMEARRLIVDAPTPLDCCTAIHPSTSSSVMRRTRLLPKISRIDVI